MGDVAGCCLQGLSHPALPGAGGTHCDSEFHLRSLASLPSVEARPGPRAARPGPAAAARQRGSGAAAPAQSDRQGPASQLSRHSASGRVPVGDQDDSAPPPPLAPPRRLLRLAARRRNGIGPARSVRPIEAGKNCEAGKHCEANAVCFKFGSPRDTATRTEAALRGPSRASEDEPLPGRVRAAGPSRPAGRRENTTCDALSCVQEGKSRFLETGSKSASARDTQAGQPGPAALPAASRLSESQAAQIEPPTPI